MGRLLLGWPIALRAFGQPFLVHAPFISGVALEDCTAASHHQPLPGLDSSVALTFEGLIQS